MINRNAVLMAFIGCGFIWLRDLFAEQIKKHYQPLCKGKLNSVNISKILSHVFFCFGLLLILLSVVWFNFGDIFFGLPKINLLVSIIVVVSGTLYLLWSLPGYYRWKKTRKGIELALFVTKLSIGILTILGVVVGYALGKI